VIYKGVSYRYAFEFAIPVEDCSDKKFSIAITGYRDDTQDFSGLCLENGLTVTSTEKILFVAFFDIIATITHITLQGEKNYAEAHLGQTPIPYMMVGEPDVLTQFEKCRKSGKSLEYYEKELKHYLENPDAHEHLSNDTKLDICDSPTMVFFANLIREKALPIKDIIFFRI
jgi:hypothetical protein